MTRRIALILPLLLSAACGSTVDLARAVAPESVTTGWADGGHVAGKNKIVPTVTFKLKNVSDTDLRVVQVNAVFRRVNDPAEWSTGYVPEAAHELPPGAETPPRTVTGQQGYTGTDDPDALLKNSHFVDAKADLFVKSGSSNWTRIGEFPIARQLVSPPAP
jgi:hypothetical protein